MSQEPNAQEVQRACSFDRFIRSWRVEDVPRGARKILPYDRCDVEGDAEAFGTDGAEDGAAVAGVYEGGAGDGVSCG